MKPTSRLFPISAVPRRRRLSGQHPVRFDPDVCPDCGAATFDITMREIALFRHGGYGADRETTTRACGAACGWAMTRLVMERNPRAASAP